MQNTRLLLGRRSSVGLSYILTTVVHERAPLFTDDAAAALAVREFQRLDQEGFTRSIAYVVMPDHIHWLVELRAGTLETVMKRFKSRTARQANRLLGRVGRFWQACYHDHAIRSDESLHRHAMYLMGNPIRAGLTTRLGQYPHAWCEWSLGRHVICPMTLAPVDSANQGWHLPKQCAHEPGGECVNQG